MDSVALRRVIDRRGPFASVYLPSSSAWESVRRTLTTARLDARSLAALDKAVARAGDDDHVFVAADGRLLVDESPHWTPPTPVARVSALPYLLPLTDRHGANRGVAAPAQPAYDRFVSQAGRPGGNAVDGLGACTSALRDHNVDLLVIAVDQLGDRRVWIGTDRFDMVSADSSLRGRGFPIVCRRADEALPTAALAVGTEVVVTADPLRLADGVGVLLRV